jgi:hypothetical protein
MYRYKFIYSIVLLSVILFHHNLSFAQDLKADWLNESLTRMEAELVKDYGEEQKNRISGGLRQVSSYWKAEDGGAAEFESFILKNYAGDKITYDALFNRFERLLEKLSGHMLEISREFRWQTDLDLGKVYPFDEIFSGYNPAAHITDDFFKNKLAFVVLLNFPLTTLEERIQNGDKWSRREWAEVRLAQRFSKRVPAGINLTISQAGAEAGNYISSYNIWMHHLLNDEGNRLFPPKLRLLSHWNLRDEIKSNYSDPTGFQKQKMIEKVMERIVDQTIPESVIDNPSVDWNPFSNEVRLSSVKDYNPEDVNNIELSEKPEPDTRYSVLLNTFKAARLVDPYSPTAPTLIARRFDENRELPEERVKEMLVKIVSSPSAAKVGELIESRLGRKLEPFDIWYNGFRPRGKYNESELDRIVSAKYPDAESFRKDIPNMLIKLGFSKERSDMLADNILVDPARGSGHAAGAAMKGEKARLRTRVEKSGMNYKGYNIAVHELGHNVEQTISLNLIDHWLLRGVPNTAFTEAIAFVFQARDLELLGLDTPDKENEVLSVLNTFWMTYEISGVALVDMEVWHWMYDNPDATPSQLREAVIRISKDIWNRYYAPLFGKEDVILLGIYSHMIQSLLYLPDYPIGHMIAFQIEENLKDGKNIGAEVERMTTMGSVLPDMWMKNATGSIVGPDALIKATEQALKELKTKDYE